MNGMRGKLIEDVKIQTLFKPVSRTGATTLYNGGSATSGAAIDMQGNDELTIVLNVGTCGAASSWLGSLIHGDTDNTEAMSAVTGGAFATITTANDDTLYVGSVRGCKRYVYLQTVQANTTATLYSAVALIGNNVAPVSQETTVAFDVEL